MTTATYETVLYDVANGVATDTPWQAVRPRNE